MMVEDVLDAIAERIRMFHIPDDVLEWGAKRCILLCVASGFMTCVVSIAHGYSEAQEEEARRDHRLGSSSTLLVPVPVPVPRSGAVLAAGPTPVWTTQAVNASVNVAACVLDAIAREPDAGPDERAAYLVRECGAELDRAVPR